MADSETHSEGSPLSAPSAQSGSQIAPSELQEALQASGVVSWVLHILNDDLRWGGAVQELLGVCPTAAEFMGIVHPLDQQWVSAARARAFAGEIPYDFEYRLQPREGKVRWVLDRARLERNEQDEPLRMLGSLVEITERRAAEDELRFQHYVARTITANAAESIFLMDAEGRVTFANPEAVRTFGYTNEELRRQILLSIIYRQVGESATTSEQSPLRQVFSTGETLRGHEDVFTRKDGTSVRVVCSNAAIRVEGKITGAVLVVHDITKHKEVENQLREREQRLSLAQAAANMRTWQADLIVDKRRAFPLLRNITGLPEGDFQEIGEWELVVHPKDRAWLFRSLRATLEGSADFDVAYRVLRSDGTVRWTAAKGVVHITPATQTQSLIGVASDITEHKEAERALAVSEERYRSIARVLTSMVWATDAEGAFVRPQVEWEAYTGQTWEQYRNFGWVNAMHPDERQDVINRWKNSVATRKPLEVAARIWHASSDSYHHFVGRAVPLLGADGTVREWIGTTTDVDDQVRSSQALEASAAAARKAQADAERAREEAEGANRAKDAFLAALSHELRTPLTPVLLSAAALCKDPTVPETIRRQIGMMQRNVELEAQLIDDLLDLTRISRGKLQLRKESCDVHALISHTMEIVRPEADLKGIELELALAPMDAFAEADPGRLQQVFWNLLRNAVKFTGHGGQVRLETAVENGEDCEDGQCWMHVHVTDSGIGISSDQLLRIFEPFEQGGLTNDHRFGGLGLGLAISRSIVEMHGGHIHAESLGKGYGARFSVDLRMQGQPAAAAPATPPPAPPPQAPAKERVSFGRTTHALRILLVEDHSHTLEMLQYLLRKDGHIVTGAPTFHAAMLAAGQDSFDCLISDLGLPDGTGLDLMRELHQRQPRLRGIALSGYGMEEDFVKSREAGFALHLTKPIDFERLQEAITQVMTASEAELPLEN